MKNVVYNEVVYDRRIMVCEMNMPWGKYFTGYIQLHHTDPRIWLDQVNMGNEDYFNVSVPYLQGLDQIWYQAECLECHKVFRISSQDADKVKCCPFCKKFYLAISKAS